VHLSHRSNWLRAAVLGANDGIVSTASLASSPSFTSAAAFQPNWPARSRSRSPATAPSKRTCAMSSASMSSGSRARFRPPGPPRRATLRVTAWGAVAMAVTAAIGALVGVVG
jgi:hypothetical protein